MVVETERPNIYLTHRVFVTQCARVVVEPLPPPMQEPRLMQHSVLLKQAQEAGEKRQRQREAREAALRATDWSALKW